MLGNAVLPHRAATRSFAEGAGWLAQIGLFVMLGLLVTPSQLPGALGPALIVGLVLLLLARPISVAACLILFRVPWREQVFISWAGLRGAVPIVLATFPIVAGVPGSPQLLNVVFVLVVIFTVVQGPTLPAIARLLGVTQPGQTREVDIESAPLDVLDAELLTFTLSPGSRLHGVEIFELRLPAPAAIILIIRGRVTFVPDPGTRLHEGDEVLIVATRTTREATERRLRAVGRRGRLACWYGEQGDLDPYPAHAAASAGIAKWTSPTPPFLAPRPSVTAPPGTDTSAVSGAPVSPSARCSSTPPPPPTSRRRP
ncbi:cation:proton antiporter [Streptosporangium subroseum]|uniref:cation:proton antiporter domain-containing protein n=1 Tax=Streptosporangium subroseum TaxID=106412 RepID=UPI00343FD6F9